MSRPSADSAPEMDSNPPTDSLNDARCGREAGVTGIDPQPDGAAMVRRRLIPRQIADPGTSVPCRFGTEESCGYDGVMGQTRDLPGGC